MVLSALSCRVYGAGFRSMDCPSLLDGFRAEGTERYKIAVLHGDPTQRESPYNPITAAQVKFFYAAASRHGLTKPEAKALVKKFGYDSASKIKTKDFDAMLAELGGTEE